MTSTTAPQLLVEAFECLQDGSRRPLGLFDLTERISEELMFGRLAYPTPEAISVRAFAGALPREAADIAWNGSLAIPGFGRAIDAFVVAIGGKAGLKPFRDHLRGIAKAQDELRRAEEVRDAVAGAAFVPLSAVSDEHMFFSSFCSSDEGYVSEPGAAHGLWRFEEYLKLNPRPPGAFDAPETEAWQKAYEAWSLDEAPPMVFCTVPHRFDGIDAAAIREDVANYERPDVPNLLENALQEHHEDAYEEIRDEGMLHDLIEKWLPHAGTGTPEDLALEAGVADWNKRQTIVSYAYDPKRYTGVRTGIDATVVAAWCSRLVERARSTLAAARLWSVPHVPETHAA